ncbi:probable UDP-sugar transporter protein SLC35A4 [Oscarella lobularis]|uniref:probable UDP-sugar transporter protein SLC35A4 n=1 Tax=Oscarella lobularis TaxID=121494 RepID=UPI003313F95C
MSSLLAVGFAFSVFIYGLDAILVNLAKDFEGNLPFNSATVALLVDAVKIAFSLVFLAGESLANHVIHPVSIRESIKFSFPALLYSINNNLFVVIQVHADPATFRILSNMKILTTAILYRIIMKRLISSKKQLALVLMTLSGMGCSYSGIASHKGDAGLDSGHMTLHLSFTGLFLILIYCGISGLAGVYIEMILKRGTQTSLHFQNLIMHIYSICFNYFWYWTSSKTSSSFLDGYNAWTVAIVLTQAMNGLILSFVFKYGSNLTRILIISCATLVTTFMSHLIFHLQLDANFFLALALFLVAFYLYHR